MHRESLIHRCDPVRGVLLEYSVEEVRSLRGGLGSSYRRDAMLCCAVYSSMHMKDVLVDWVCITLHGLGLWICICTLYVQMCLHIYIYIYIYLQDR